MGNFIIFKSKKQDTKFICKSGQDHWVEHQNTWYFWTEMEQRGYSFAFEDVHENLITAIEFINVRYIDKKGKELYVFRDKFEVRHVHEQDSEAIFGWYYHRINTI